MSILDGIAEMFAELSGRDATTGQHWLDKVVTPPRTLEHGYRAYVTFGCRCETCRAANAAYMRDYAKRRRAEDPTYRARRAKYEADRRARRRAERSGLGERGTP